MGLLDVTLSSDSLVGSNLRGGASGGGWLYALPRLSYDNVVCLGAPSAATLTGLARAGGRVTVLVAAPFARRRLAGLVRAHGWAHVTVRRWSRSDWRDTDRIELLAVFDQGAAVRRRAARLHERLAGDGVAYYTREPAGPPPGAGQRVTLSLTPSHGEVRTVVPTHDRAMRRAVRSMGLEGTILSRPKLSRWERELTARLGLDGARRSATLVGGPLVDLSGAPAYVRAIAAADDVALDGWSYGVSARGNYDSQKILVLLTPAGVEEPTVVVKVTRSQAHAPRLQNEAAILGQVAQLRTSAGRTPVPWFSGFHAGRAVLGMSLMDGVPYTVTAALPPAGEASDGSPGARRAHGQLADALGWLTDLAEETAHPADSAQLATVLLTLLDRFERVYAPPQAEAAVLRAEFERLADLDRPLPIVVQHGDPGIWNLLVDGEGRTVFLDWESGEPDGMPLWDLLYLFRSHAIEAARRDGVSDRVEAAVRALTGAGPLPDLLVEAIRRYCQRVGLPLEAVEPLMLGCWLHRALKEAGRSSAANLDEGLSVRLLRRMLAEPDAPARQRLRPPT